MDAWRRGQGTVATRRRLVAAAAAWLPVLLFSCPTWAAPAAPSPVDCRHREAQLHVWLVAAGPYRASPGCVVYHRSWAELRKHRASAPAGAPVRVWPVTAKRLAVR